MDLLLHISSYYGILSILYSQTLRRGSGSDYISFTPVESQYFSHGRAYRKALISLVASPTLSEHTSYFINSSNAFGPIQECKNNGKCSKTHYSDNFRERLNSDCYIDSLEDMKAFLRSHFPQNPNIFNQCDGGPEVCFEEREIAVGVDNVDRIIIPKMHEVSARDQATLESDYSVTLTDMYQSIEQMYSGKLHYIEPDPLRNMSFADRYDIEAAQYFLAKLRGEQTDIVYASFTPANVAKGIILQSEPIEPLIQSLLAFKSRTTRTAEGSFGFRKNSRYASLVYHVQETDLNRITTRISLHDDMIDKALIVSSVVLNIVSRKHMDDVVNQLVEANVFSREVTQKSLVPEEYSDIPETLASLDWNLTRVYTTGTISEFVGLIQSSSGCQAVLKIVENDAELSRLQVVNEELHTLSLVPPLTCRVPVIARGFIMGAGEMTLQDALVVSSASARRIGELFKRLHTSGYAHNDAHDKNVVFIGDEVFFIDIDTVQRNASEKNKRSDIALILASGKVDREAFLEAYS